MSRTRGAIKPIHYRAIICVDGTSFYDSFSSVIGAYQVMHKLQANPNSLYNSIRLDFYWRLHLRCFYNLFFYLIELSKVECMTGKNAYRKEKNPFLTKGILMIHERYNSNKSKRLISLEHFKSVMCIVVIIIARF